MERVYARDLSSDYLPKSRRVKCLEVTEPDGAGSLIHVHWEIQGKPELPGLVSIFSPSSQGTTTVQLGMIMRRLHLSKTFTYRGKVDWRSFLLEGLPGREFAYSEWIQGWPWPEDLKESFEQREARLARHFHNQIQGFAASSEATLAAALGAKTLTAEAKENCQQIVKALGELRQQLKIRKDQEL